MRFGYPMESVRDTQRVNTYIEGAPSGEYVVQRAGAQTAYPDRYVAIEADPDFSRAWECLKGGAVALQRRQLNDVVSHTLTGTYRVHSGTFRDRHGDPATLAIFTQVLPDATTDAPETITAVQVSCRNDVVHFRSQHARDVGMFQELLDARLVAAGLHVFRARDGT